MTSKRYGEKEIPILLIPLSYSNSELSEERSFISKESLRASEELWKRTTDPNLEFNRRLGELSFDYSVTTRRNRIACSKMMEKFQATCTLLLSSFNCLVSSRDLSIL